jgi:hypothetical protein
MREPATSRLGKRRGRWGVVGGTGPYIRARSGAPLGYLALRCLRGPALGGELRAPEWRDRSKMPAARAKAERPDGRLSRWTGAEGSGPMLPNTP